MRAGYEGSRSENRTWLTRADAAYLHPCSPQGGPADTVLLHGTKHICCCGMALTNVPLQHYNMTWGTMCPLQHGKATDSNNLHEREA